MNNQTDSNNNNIQQLGNHLLNQVFFNKYKLVKKLGEGSFGMIFEAESSSGKVAFKFEKKRPNKKTLLKNEAAIMQYLKGKGIPSIELYKEEENYSVMIMELLGKSIENLLKHSEKMKFSVKTVALLGLELIPIMKFIHDRHIIHRDIKPDNFAIGYDDPCQIYILDFGLSKKFRSSKTLQQLPMIKHSRLTGTARYASINALIGYEQSRRDDLESLGYVMAYLLRGSLPWQGIAAKTKEDKYAKILHKKEITTPDNLLKNQPKEFVEYIKYCKMLGYEQDPDYSYLEGLFKKIIIEDLHEKIDYKFDWATDQDAEFHMRSINESPNEKDNNAMNNDISFHSNSNICNTKNEVNTEENEKQTKNDELNYYDEVIDELFLIKKNAKKEKGNLDDNASDDQNENNKRHGQCCLIM